MKRLNKRLIAMALLAAFGITAQASSHREALAVLNEPFSSSPCPTAGASSPASSTTRISSTKKASSIWST